MKPLQEIISTQICQLEMQYREADKTTTTQTDTFEYVGIRSTPQVLCEGTMKSRVVSYS